MLQDLQDVAAVEFEASDNDEEGEASYADLVEFVRLIPVSLSTGRQKQAVADIAIFKNTLKNQAASAKLVQDDNISIVDMFTPERPS